MHRYLKGVNMETPKAKWFKVFEKGVEGRDLYEGEEVMLLYKGMEIKGEYYGHNGYTLFDTEFGLQGNPEVSHWRPLEK